MIDIGSETLALLTRVARNFPAPESKRGIDVRVLHRWGSDGVHGIRLEIVRKDGCTWTSYEALGRFMERLAREYKLHPDLEPLRYHSEAVRLSLARVRGRESDQASRRSTGPRLRRREDCAGSEQRASATRSHANQPNAGLVTEGT